ncbi:hypothetical protein J4218_01490 [Candidatus Pacearchaeota archaeon]|nr:hypothetical protein [Candidatus Pacearchaeota archaeon]
MKKNMIKNLKVYFMIVNVILGIIAFSYIISAPTGTDMGNNEGTTIPGSGTNTNIPGGTVINDNPNGDSTGVGTDNTNTGDGTGGTGTGTGDPINGGWGTGNINFQSIIMKAGIGVGIFSTIGSLAGGENGALWGSVAGAIGGVVAGLAEGFGIGPVWSSIIGLSVATIIFILTYYKKSTQVVEFGCLPWQAPVGGDYCQMCNNYKECSEYTCKSLGQACDIINAGTPQQKCIWKNPNDVNSPIIKMTKVSKNHTWVPNNAVRPPATGVIIKNQLSSDGCLKAYTPLEFTFTTLDTGTGVGEPSQCKIDYVLTTTTATNNSKSLYDDMTYYVGGDDLYAYNHTEKLALPGPDAINAVAPVLKNNGEYTLYIRCRDANGNFNVDAFSVNFCVQKGPDTTAPAIVGTNIESNKPILFNQTKLNLEVYVNEPSECRWSRTDIRYDYMENNMTCDTNVWEMNNNLVYTCRTVLTGIQDRKENDYYFRCKDQPFASEGDRNVNQQSYHYVVIGTQPLNIMSITPERGSTISGSTDTIPVFLTIETDNGYKDGEALCYYSKGNPAKEEDYILFANTSSSHHNQRQDLISGNYSYYFKCVDLGGNSAYNSTNFKVDTDKREPVVVRVYRDIGELKIITDENAECSYSLKNCNFEIESGIKMTSFNGKIHTTEWKFNQNYYIRCMDNYNNQPNPNTCSIIARPSKIEPIMQAIEL